MAMRLREIKIEDITRWPKIQKCAVLAALLFTLLGLGYFLRIKPTVENYAAQQQEEIVLKATLASKEYQASSGYAYQRQIALAQDLLHKQLKKLPAQQEMPGLLDNISTVVKQSGLTMQSFIPQKEVSQGWCIVLPITLSLRGTYIQFIDFFTKMHAMQEILYFHALRLERLPSTEGMLALSLEIKIYKYPGSKSRLVTGLKPLNKSYDFSARTNDKTVAPGNYDLVQYFASLKYTQAKPIDPLPQLPALASEKFLTPSAVMCSPFEASQCREKSGNRAVTHRKQHPLEAFSLKELQFMGTLQQGDIAWALIQRPDDKLTKISVGGFMGKHQGRLISIDNTVITLEEVVAISGLKTKRVVALHLGQH